MRGAVFASFFQLHSRKSSAIIQIVIVVIVVVIVVIVVIIVVVIIVVKIIISFRNYPYGIGNTLICTQISTGDSRGSCTYCLKFHFIVNPVIIVKSHDICISDSPAEIIFIETASLFYLQFKIIAEFCCFRETAYSSYVVWWIFDSNGDIVQFGSTNNVAADFCSAGFQCSDLNIVIPHISLGKFDNSFCTHNSPV